jgi:hypothetical protein
VNSPGRGNRPTFMSYQLTFFNADGTILLKYHLLNNSGISQEKR